MGKKDFCCAPGCAHQRSSGATCSMHRIPQQPQWLRQAWLKNLRRDEIVNGKKVPWTPRQHSRLCSCHFDEPPSQSPFSKKFPIPTKFNHSISSLSTRKDRSTKNSTSGRQTVKRKLVEYEDEKMPPKKKFCDASVNTDSLIPAELECHDYISTTVDESSYDVLNVHPDLTILMKEHVENQQKADTLDQLNSSGQILCLENIKQDRKLIKYYTGLPSYDVFFALFFYLEKKAADMKYPYGEKTVLHKHYKKSMLKKPGRNRSKTLQEELFMTLVRLKLGIPSADCAIRFGIAESTFSSIFTAWVSLLSVSLEQICKMPPTSDLDAHDEADCFSDFSNLRIIIDCTELFSETPSSLSAQKQFFSNYKHHSTVKFLVGMNTGGAVTYISEMFGGRASDKFITNESEDLLCELLPGEKVMADRGFTIDEDLPLGVKLIIPSFKQKDKSQFSKDEVRRNKKISEARVHIERAIRRIKQFLILKNEMKISQVDLYEKIFKSCGYLVNFQDSFLKV